jgi:hypothetical protein
MATRYVFDAQSARRIEGSVLWTEGLDRSGVAPPRPVGSRRGKAEVITGLIDQPPVGSPPVGGTQGGGFSAKNCHLSDRRSIPGMDFTDTNDEAAGYDIPNVSNPYGQQGADDGAVTIVMLKEETGGFTFEALQMKCVIPDPPPPAAATAEVTIPNLDPLASGSGSTANATTSQPNIASASQSLTGAASANT